jgi:glyoxylase-like metal-dependent hydrolase (beta-lactamase superfamily II)
LRILLCWTANDAHGRGLLFDLGPEIAAQTGWYPMVIGPWRAPGRDAAVHLARGALRAPPELAWPLGELVSIRDLTYGKGNESGVAFALQTSEAQLVFDLGMLEANPDLVEAIETANLIVVSHAHRDHAGGLPMALERSKAPILMTEATLLELLSIRIGLDAGLVKTLLGRALVCTSDGEVRFGDGGTLNLWPANHGPGSVCSLVSTSSGTTLMYSGDFSITSAYGDTVLHAIRGTGSRPMPRQVDWAIVDGTFLGRRLETAKESAYFSDFIRQTIDAQRHGLVIADASDVALLLYLELFGLAMGRNKRAEVQVYQAQIPCRCYL